MYRIFLHVLVLSLLEIIFYFNYIGPLETKIFKESFRGPDLTDIESETVQNRFLLDDNSIKNITNKYQKESKIAEKLRNEHNNELYHKTLNYWGIYFAITIFITLVQFSWIYYKNCNKRKRKNSCDTEIEMTTINNDTTNLLNNRYNDQDNNENSNKFIKALLILIYYIFLFGFILLFEYLFFQNVVLKYHIISSKELELLILQTYLPVINNLIINNKIA